MDVNTIFQSEIIPNGTSLAGFSFIIKKHDIPAHVRFPSCVAHEHVRGTAIEKSGWRIFDKRYWPGDDEIAHLVFALKHEDFDLLCVKRILQALPKGKVETYVNSVPTGVYARKIWFLYEWLLETKLDLLDCPKCQTKPLLDQKNYFVSDGSYSKRHRITNNLLGTKLFCPVIRKTPALLEFIKLDLKKQVDHVIDKVSEKLIARAASFLLLADSKASFAIEGERVPINRVERWGKAVSQAGKFTLSPKEFIRLQKIIIKDTRFTKVGLRTEGVFLGECDSEGTPIPEFIGAKPDDLESLTGALVEADNAMNASELDPVLHAAAIAFGFVYLHPLEDGNGRIHRYLIHHVLAERGFSHPGIVFPVSSAMLHSIDLYRGILQKHSAPLMEFIEWGVTEKKNVRVLNNTRDLYSYFDCTEACEYLYSCVNETIKVDLPSELKYLKAHDQAFSSINNLLDMPDNSVKSLIVFIRQNGGVLSKKRRKNDFPALTDEEVSAIEALVKEAFAE